MNDRLPARVFTLAGVYGLILLLPQYALESRIGRDTPPPITHPEYFYGFIGVTVLWQLAFLLIGRDPVRFRPLMPVAVLEKVVFALPALVLVAMRRSPDVLIPFAVIDLALGLLFLIAWRRTPVH